MRELVSIQIIMHPAKSLKAPSSAKHHLHDAAVCEESHLRLPCYTAAMYLHIKGLMVLVGWQLGVIAGQLGGLGTPAWPERLDSRLHVLEA